MKRSSRTKISSFLLSLEKDPAKSIVIEEKGSLETGRGETIPSGTVVGCLFIWQGWHRRMKSLKSFLIVIQ